METDLTLLCLSILHHEWGSFSNQQMATPKDPRVPKCQLDSLYPHHKLLEPLATAYVEHGVSHRIHVRGEVLEKHQRIIVEFVLPDVSPSLETHSETLKS